MKVLESGVGAGWSKEDFGCSATRWLEKSGPDPVHLEWVDESQKAANILLLGTPPSVGYGVRR